MPGRDLTLYEDEFIVTATPQYGAVLDPYDLCPSARVVNLADYEIPWKHVEYLVNEGYLVALENRGRCVYRNQQPVSDYLQKATETNGKPGTEAEQIMHSQNVGMREVLDIKPMAEGERAGEPAVLTGIGEGEQDAALWALYLFRHAVRDPVQGKLYLGFLDLAIPPMTS